MAFAGISAIVSAIGTGAAISGTMVLAAVANVGTILSVVGAVTGSKDLMKIGGFMSLAGGVGGAVAGAANGAASAAASTVAGEAAGGLATDALAGSVDLATGISTDTLANAAGEQFAGALPTFQAAGSAVTAPVSAGGGGLIGEAMGPLSTPPVAPTSTLPGPAAVQGATAPADIAAPALADTTAIATPAGVTGGAQPSGSWWDSMKDSWSNASDATKNSIVKTGTGLIQGMAQASAADKAAAQRREEMNMRYGHANAVPRGIINKAAAA